MAPRIPDDKPPRPDRRSHDDLGAFAAADAREEALRRAKVKAEQDAARIQALEQQVSALAKPPPATEIELPVDFQAAVNRGKRFGEKAAYAIGTMLGVAALVGSGAIGGRVVQDNPKPAKQAVVEDLAKRVDRLETRVGAQGDWLKLDYKDRLTKEALLLAWACSRGFRADDIRCPELKDEAEADDAALHLPSKERAAVAPEWRTRVAWPAPRQPPKKPSE